jgi:hypothetical protein
MEKVMNNNGFLNQLKLKRKMNITCNLESKSFRKKDIFFKFRFNASRWLNKKTETFIDLLPEEPKPPLPKKGKKYE